MPPAPEITTFGSEAADQAAMVPRPFRVVRRHTDTADTVTLCLEPLDGNGLHFAPGQFTMLGEMGIGEVPISISGNPAEQKWLWHTIRDVGGVSRVLASCEPGAIVEVRGPFGVGWNTADALHGDVVLVAGGIGLAPLRPAMLEVLARRDEFARVFVLYGARSPADVLFAEELMEWSRLPGVTVEITVDCADTTWRRHVGLVTKLIPRAAFEPSRTLALVCGPEVMMRYAAAALADRGVPRSKIRLSMERNMRCGIGLCGHCQLRQFFICRDGPVLGYDRLDPLLSVREL